MCTCSRVSFNWAALTLLFCTLGRVLSVSETQSCTTGFLPMSNVTECSGCGTGGNTAATRLIPDMNFTCAGTVTKWRAAGEVHNNRMRVVNYMMGIWRQRNTQPGTYDRTATIELGACTNASTVAVAGQTGVYECTLSESLRVPVEPGDVVGVDIADNNDYRFRLHFDTNGGPKNYMFNGNVSTANLSQSVSTEQEQPQISLTVEESTNAPTTDEIMLTTSTNEAPTGMAATTARSPTTTTPTTRGPTTTISMDNQTTDPTTVTTMGDQTMDPTTTQPTMMTSTDARSTPEPTTTASGAGPTTDVSSKSDTTTTQNDTPTTTSSAGPTMNGSQMSGTTTSQDDAHTTATSPGSQEAASDGNSGLIAGVIIGVVIGILLVAVIVILLVLVILRRPTSRKYDPKDNNIIANPIYDDSIVVKTPDGAGLVGEYSVVGCDHSAMDYEDIENKPPDLPPVDRLLTWSINDYTKTPKPVDMSSNESPIRTLPKLPSSTATGNFQSGILYVPSQEQRNRVSMNLNNGDVYSAIGSSQYSDSGPTPMLFEEDDTYWVPASDANELYKQLSSKKYREIIRQQIQITSHLGAGQFGTVDKGIWQSPMGALDVAVKQLQPGASEEEKVKFLQEAAINGQFRHPNVVKLMGVVTVGEPTMIVLELLSNGDLHNYLVKQQPSPGEILPSNTQQVLLKFCQQVASGMEYLSRKAFIHRDLAARNILVAEDKTCKISDFGMSRDLMDENYYVSHGGKVPVKWTAPEAIHYKKYSTASDVWSFACVMYEIWSLGHKPFEAYRNAEVIKMVDNGYRLPPPPGLSKELYKIMIHCWHGDRASRPTFPQLVEMLSRADFELFAWDEGDLTGCDPKAKVIGASLDTATNLYSELQRSYLSS